jgi:hypothetical protein
MRNQCQWSNSEDEDESCTSEAARYGRIINTGGFMRRYHADGVDPHYGGFDSERYDQIRKSAEHDIYVKPNTDGSNGNLPFNYQSANQGGKIDLVVGETSCTDARSLLNSFDLSICAASFDGAKFRIPHPHLTFNGKVVIEPKRLALMAKYSELILKQKKLGNELSQASYEHSEGNELLHLPPAQRAVINEMHQQDLFEQARLRRPCQVAGDESAFRRYHKSIARLFYRRRKYLSRGIKVINSPVDADAATEIILSSINSENLNSMNCGRHGW